MMTFKTFITMGTTQTNFLNKKNYVFLLNFLISAFLFTQITFSTFAQEPNEASPFYRLESIVVKGSLRLSADELNKALALQYGQALDDQLVMDTRAKLLGLGVFNSVTLYLKKGQSKGWAQLIIEVEDDPNVLTKWAIGASVAVTQSEQQAKAGDPDTAALGYRLDLISRNFLRSLHRTALSLDIDSQGVLRQGRAAYGLPRFAAEDTQFDLEFEVVDVALRYLNTLGFGRRAQGLWSKSITARSGGQIQYGVALYANESDRFSHPGFPATVGGPKLSYIEETRLLSFIPGPGTNFQAALLISPVELQESVLEIQAAKTIQPIPNFSTTLSFKGLSVGDGSISLRSEARVDVPFPQLFGISEQAEIFARLRGGLDLSSSQRLSGSAAILGLRYHSSGFIAEFSVQITTVPQELGHIKDVAEQKRGRPL